MAVYNIDLCPPPGPATKYNIIFNCATFTVGEAAGCEGDEDCGAINAAVAAGVAGCQGDEACGTLTAGNAITGCEGDEACGTMASSYTAAPIGCAGDEDCGALASKTFYATAGCAGDEDCGALNGVAVAQTSGCEGDEDCGALTSAAEGIGVVAGCVGDEACGPLTPTFGLIAYQVAGCEGDEACGPLGQGYPVAGCPGDEVCGPLNSIDGNTVTGCEGDEVCSPLMAAVTGAYSVTGCQGDEACGTLTAVTPALVAGCQGDEACGAVTAVETLKVGAVRGCEGDEACGLLQLGCAGGIGTDLFVRPAAGLSTGGTVVTAVSGALNVTACNDTFVTQTLRPMWTAVGTATPVPTDRLVRLQTAEAAGRVHGIRSTVPENDFDVEFTFRLRAYKRRFSQTATLTLAELRLDAGAANVRLRVVSDDGRTRKLIGSVLVAGVEDVLFTQQLGKLQVGSQAKLRIIRWKSQIVLLNGGAVVDRVEWPMNLATFEARIATDDEAKVLVETDIVRFFRRPLLVFKNTPAVDVRWELGDAQVVASTPAQSLLVNAVDVWAVGCSCRTSVSATGFTYARNPELIRLRGTQGDLIVGNDPSMTNRSEN